MKKLFIDVEKLMGPETDIDEIECSYFYHRENQGAYSLLEVVEFAVYCRKCKIAFCVEACPRDALELTEQNIVKRYNMRCIGCKSCTLACPFGTIFPNIMNYIADKCDVCLDKRRLDPDYVPLCVRTSPEGAIELKDIEKEDPENDIFFYGDHIAIKSHHWLEKEEKI
jgi:Fe-S-cluster-containing dehydrogenase component